MLVYRFETPEGVGMYYHDASTNIINNGSSDRKKWPMPYDDALLKSRKAFHISDQYPDQEKLQGSQTQSMFYEWCEDLRNCGLFEFYDETKYRFGFSSYEQMERWVSEFEWRAALVHAKVYLNVYEVSRDQAIVGDTQCTFRLDKAKLLHSFIATSSQEHIASVLRNKQSTSDAINEYYKDFYNENA